MQIQLDQREYSRYTSGRDVVTATISGATPNDSIEVALVREDGYGDVAKVAATTNGSGAATVAIPLAAAAQDGINYARQGRYHVDARGTTSGRSGSVPISVITVDEWRRAELFGVTLHAEEILMPVRQPRTVTGVRVEYIDNGMLKGRGALAYVHTANTLSWRGGPAETIVGSDVQTLRLLTPEEDAYIEVEVTPAALPGADAAETLLIDNWRMTDDDLRRYLWQAYDAVQQQLQIRLEPTITTTRADMVAYYDELVDAQPLERNKNRTIFLRSPAARPLLRVIALKGFYVNQEAILIPREWITTEEKAAIIELVPISGAALISPAAAVWGWNLNALQLGREVQDFWNFAVVAGLRTLDGGRYSIREAIGKYAAMRALTDLSLGASGGRTSRSASREGISESWSWHGQGAFGEKIAAYQDWLNTTMPKLKTYYGGVNVVTLG